MTDLADSTTFVAMDTIANTTTYTYEQKEVMFNEIEDEITNAYIVLKYIPGSSYNN